MRPVYLCDLDAATRALLAVTEDQRHAVASDIVQAADAGDRYRKRFKRAHPVFGSGTLTSAAQPLGKACAPYCHREYRDCLTQLLAALSHQSA